MDLSLRVLHAMDGQGPSTVLRCECPARCSNSRGAWSQPQVSEVGTWTT
jgi:hypothetical protein